MNDLQRAKVCSEARTWKGTPYGHRQRERGLACDCALFPLAVYQAVGILPVVPVRDYNEQWFLHRAEELYIDDVLALGAVETDRLDPGNFILWKFGRAYSHGAIILDWPTVIHSLRPHGVMTTDALNDGQLRHRPYKVFTL